MGTPIWTSEGIHLADGVCIDVSASIDGVTVGESAGKVLAADLHISEMENVALLADALTQGAAHCLAARGQK